MGNYVSLVKNEFPERPNVSETARIIVDAGLFLESASDELFEQINDSRLISDFPSIEETDLKHYSVHSLRHTNITLLMIAGVPVVTVSNRVGHSKSMTTLNVYADYLGSSDLEASSKINQYFSEKKEIILKAE